MKPIPLRILLWLFTRAFYRVNALSPDNVPDKGGALLVSNHVSFMDMLLILASTRRFVRFLFPQEICERLVVKALPAMAPGHSTAVGIPTARTQSGPATRAREAIRQGEVVGIFAERTISRIGVMLPFRREFERIMEGVDAPIIPVCLDGVWGSIFSYQKGRFFWKLPRRLPLPGHRQLRQSPAAPRHRL